MSTFRVRCSSCGKTLQVPEAARGKKAACPCGQKFRLPEEQSRPKPAKPVKPKKRRPKKKEPVVYDDPEVIDDFEEYEESSEFGGFGDDFEDIDDFEEAAPPPRRRKNRSGGSRKSRSRGSAKTEKSIWGFFSGRNAILKALDEYESDTGKSFELIKAGMPPLRLWLKNRKGDRWGLVENRSGKQFWVRYRLRLFSNGPALTFFD